jgi:NTP pyrophosphatase (non-canonical NTP hydrolase)
MDIKELAQKAVEIKEKYCELERKKYGKEWSRTQVMEGFVGDVGDLMKLVMAKDGIRNAEDVDDKIAHELADCLFSVLVLSQKYDVDIEKSFLDTMDMLEKRISEEL